MSESGSYYQMHKYWGKKPSKDLNELIETYSKEGDIVLDPFAGYGVFVCEAYLSNRNAIGNDLNPSSKFIQERLLDDKVDLSLLIKESDKLLNDILAKKEECYSTDCPNCKKKCLVIATLRTKDNKPIRNRVDCNCTKSAFEFDLSENESLKILEHEKSLPVLDHPCVPLIKNGRISAFEGMTTDDLFTLRALHCHSYLFDKINMIEDINIRNHLKFAFTSNLANCSRLVPPIKSRGPMAPGAWMTGFYIGDTYIENNVFHYFENRLQKLIRGKQDYFNQNNKQKNINDKGKVASFAEFDRKSKAYIIDNQDCKNLNYADASIDYVFTDPPYGDSVPYFEQSTIWNAWLGFCPDYKNEVVISDSKARGKNQACFADDILKCISEIYRVLKSDSYFSITFHSISGSEWYAFTRACLECGFILHELKWLTQKTFAPRQLNRMKTVKGDILITFKKSKTVKPLKKLNVGQSIELIKNEAAKILATGPKDTNEIYLHLLRKIFSERLLFEEVNFLEILNQNYPIDSNGFWNNLTETIKIDGKMVAAAE
jgi:DNA modification methylase